MENNLTDPVKDFLRFQLNRKVINLYKNFLILLEDLKCPPYNSLSDEDYKKIRKKILDMGNDILREIDEDFSKIDVTFKNEYRINNKTEISATD